MKRERQASVTGVEVLFVGEETNSNDPLEATGVLAGVPAPGDEIVVWTGDWHGEVYLTVERVSWPAFQYAHDPGPIPPKVLLRREGGYSDEEWREFFKAVDEKRHP